MKKIRILPVLLLLAFSLSGCTFPSGDELLAAPKPSSNYETLQTELENQLASGVTYTAPTGGENRSAIQLVDLDGDGIDEAIAFFRGSSSITSSEFKVSIYKKQEDKYVCTGSIEGKGTAIQSVDFPTITPAGAHGMVIAWKLPGDGVGALTMCDFDEACQPGVLLETEYSAMELTDLTGDGAKDLLLLAGDQSGKRVARLYRYVHGALELAGETGTTTEAVTIERMSSGYVRDRQPAVFAEERTTGGVGLTTDIFVYADGKLQNLALDSEDSMGRGTYRPVSVYAADINGDGVTELPRAVLMAGYTEQSADALYMLDWYAYGADAAPELVLTTYQNVADGWTLTIDPAWHDIITAVKSSESGLNAVTFSQYVSKDEQIPLFTIYSATGTTREYYVTRDDLIQLGQTAKTLCFARIADPAQQSAVQIDAAGIQSRFSLIAQDWNN